MLSWLFFFFQAEDGIRDGTVTGVQTCALPISYPVALEQLVRHLCVARDGQQGREPVVMGDHLVGDLPRLDLARPDRKSTRLNSSHSSISYAVFCLKKKKQ